MKSLHVGKVGVDYTTEEAAELAKWIGLELIATLKGNVANNDLDKVRMCSRTGCAAAGMKSRHVFLRCTMRATR